MALYKEADFDEANSIPHCRLLPYSQHPLNTVARLFHDINNPSIMQSPAASHAG